MLNYLRLLLSFRNPDLLIMLKHLVKRQSSRMVTGVFKYSCTDGMHGLDFYFSVRDGIVNDVSIRGID